MLLQKMLAPMTSPSIPSVAEASSRVYWLNLQEKHGITVGQLAAMGAPTRPYLANELRLDSYDNIRACISALKRLLNSRH